MAALRLETSPWMIGDSVDVLVDRTTYEPATVVATDEVHPGLPFGRKFEITAQLHSGQRVTHYVDYNGKGFDRPGVPVVKPAEAVD